MTTKEKEVERIFKESYTPLYYYALTFVDNEEVCKDVVGDVFEELWQNFDSLNRETLSAYLHTCVKNRCIDHLRRRSVNERYIAFYSLDVKTGMLDTDREEEERLARLEKSIGEMSARRRFVLEECFFHKKTYKEVAEILGMTTDGIKKHIVTALRKLREDFLGK